MYSDTSKLWSYLVAVAKLKTKYMSGKFGQMIDGAYCYDCICLIKSFPWCSGVAGANPMYTVNGVADEWIGAYYQKATVKDTDMSKIPDGIYLVYLNNEHVGVYNSQTGTVIECCGGNTCKVIERPLNFYDDTPYKWNKWSNLYWCKQSSEVNKESTIIKSQPVPQPVPETDKTYYRVQTGSFEVKDNAVRQAKTLKSQGFSAIIKLFGTHYRVQTGAYTVRKNAEAMLSKVKSAGYSSAYITTEGGTDVSF